MGFLTIVVVYLHCRTAFLVTAQRSVLGVVLMVMLIALAITGLLCKRIPKTCLRIHRVLTLVLCLGVFLHSFIEFNFFTKGV